MVSFIRSSSDYRRLAQSKKRINASRIISAKYLEHEDGFRVGWSLPRQVGNAVVRNRIKRWLREYIKSNSKDLGQLKAEVSLYFRSHKDCRLKDIEHEDFDKQLNKLFQQLRNRLS